MTIGCCDATAVSGMHIPEIIDQAVRATFCNGMKCSFWWLTTTCLCPYHRAVSYASRKIGCTPSKSLHTVFGSILPSCFQLFSDLSLEIAPFWRLTILQVFFRFSHAILSFDWSCSNLTDVSWRSVPHSIATYNNCPEFILLKNIHFCSSVAYFVILWKSELSWCKISVIHRDSKANCHQ